jgi:hypothetical protein
MSGNIDAIFSRVGNTSTNGTTGMSQGITTAANDFTGVSANNTLVWTADPTNGGYIRTIRCKALGTNVATVVRFFLNNGSSNTTAANNYFFGEQALPATTATATNVTSNDFEYPVFAAFDPGFRLYAGLATAVAAGWTFVAIGGKY